MSRNKFSSEVVDEWATLRNSGETFRAIGERYGAATDTVRHNLGHKQRAKDGGKQELFAALEGIFERCPRVEREAYDWAKNAQPDYEDAVSLKILELRNAAAHLTGDEDREFERLFYRCRSLFDNAGDSMRARLAERAANIVRSKYCNLEMIRTAYVLWAWELEAELNCCSKC